MNARPRTALITGTNRGIGLGLTRKFLQQGLKVYATARHPDGARALWELEHDFKSQLTVLSLDVSDQDSVGKLAASFDAPHLDILVNNAGIASEWDRPLAELQLDAVEKILRVNALAPIAVTKALLGKLRAAPAPVVANISSLMGSIGDNSSGGAYGYRMSKAALNMFTKSLAKEDQKLTAVALHPGWVKTDMGGPQAPIQVEESTEGLAKVILALASKDSGKFLDFRGKELPW